MITLLQTGKRNIIITFSLIIKLHSRIPVTEERSPGEDCFDMMVEALKTEPASTPCVFSDQMGRGRTTAGMITACLIKELQITTELRSERGLLPTIAC